MARMYSNEHDRHCGLPVDACSEPVISHDYKHLQAESTMSIMFIAVQLPNKHQQWRCLNEQVGLIMIESNQPYMVCPGGQASNDCWLVSESLGFKPKVCRL